MGRPTYPSYSKCQIFFGPNLFSLLFSMKVPKKNVKLFTEDHETYLRYKVGLFFERANAMYTMIWN